MLEQNVACNGYITLYYYKMNKIIYRLPTTERIAIVLYQAKMKFNVEFTEITGAMCCAKNFPNIETPNEIVYCVGGGVDATFCAHSMWIVKTHFHRCFERIFKRKLTRTYTPYPYTQTAFSST